MNRLRIAEFAGPGSGIAAGYAGWLLARMGAEVVRFGAPAPPVRADALGMACEALTQGKSVAPPGACVDDLLVDCDAVICDAPGALTATPAALRAAWPDRVIAFATPFGLEGPGAALRGGALEAQALSGMAWALGEPGREPLTLPPGVADHQAGVMLASGVLMALEARDRIGGGRLVDIALTDVLASHVSGNCRFYVHHGLKWQRSGRRASGSGGAYPFLILPCADGAVCVTGRTREEWQRLVAAMGDPPWSAEPRYQDLRAMGTAYPEEVDALVAPWFARHTKAELEALALANNLMVAPLRGLDEVLATPQFAARGYWCATRAAGRPLRMPGLPFRAHAARAAGAADLSPALLGAAGGAAARAPGSADAARPLAGLRIVDFGWVWSAPWISTMLGELGAEVIKVEHAKRPDNLRLSGRIVRDGRPVEGSSREMSPMYHQVNHGKRGITLDVKQPRAAELARRLVAMSDLVIENMSPGAMERAGLGYESLRARNPKLVMLAMSAAGQFGELAGMRGYAPTMSSFVGLEALVGYRDAAPIGALNVALGDPNAALHGLLAALAALRRARLTGEGCYVDLSQSEALLANLRAPLIEHQVTGRPGVPVGNAHPGYAPHGIYPAREPDAWLTIAAPDEAAWRALAALAPQADWACDARFARPAGRLEHGVALDAALAQWTRGFARDDLVARLRAAGLRSAPVLSVEAMWADAQVAARGMRHRVSVPVYGDLDVYSAPWRFSDCASVVERCGPGTGEHNDTVFADLLGLSADEITALRRDGVIA